jgi:hypothetical protein
MDNGDISVTTPYIETKFGFNFVMKIFTTDVKFVGPK